MPQFRHNFIDGKQNLKTRLDEITRTEYIVPLWEESYFPQSIS